MPKEARDFRLASKAMKGVMDWFQSWNDSMICPQKGELENLNIIELREIWRNIKPICSGKKGNKLLKNICKSNTKSKSFFRIEIFLDLFRIGIFH